LTSYKTSTGNIESICSIFLRREHGVVPPLEVERKVAIIFDSWPDDQHGAMVETYIMHLSGQWMMSEFSMRSVDGKPQAIGTLITYLRRYSLGAMLGMVAEEDDDGNSGSGTNASRQQQQQPMRSTRPVSVQVSTPKVAAEGAQPNDTELARDLRNKVIEVGGVDLNVVKQYFAGIWPDGAPKDSAAYIKPLTDLLAYISRGQDERANFKTNPTKLGTNWAQKNGSSSETSDKDLTVEELADAVAAKHSLGTGLVLLKTMDKLFKDVPNYKDDESMKAFLLKLKADPEAIEDAKASAALGVSLKEMMKVSA
jgi:hypothetical protein